MIVVIIISRQFSLLLEFKIYKNQDSFIQCISKKLTSFLFRMSPNRIALGYYIKS